MVVRQLGERQFIPATAGLAQLEFLYDDPMASRNWPDSKVLEANFQSQYKLSWQQGHNGVYGMEGSKARDLMTSLMMDREPIEEAPQEGSSD